MEKYSLGIIGYGNMSGAVLKQLKINGVKPAGSFLDIKLYDIKQERLTGCEYETGFLKISKAESVKGLLAECDYILLAVKPQNANEILTADDFSEKVIISIMAGKSIKELSVLSGSKKIARIMPNLNAKIGKSLNAYSLTGLDTRQEAFIKAFLTSFGKPLQIPEQQINAVTGLSGSGPAFVFMFLKGFIDAGKDLGFSEEVSKDIAKLTILNSVENILNEKDKTIDEMINSVCSKGGTTVEGVNHLREKKFEEIVKTAIKKSAARAKELEN